MRRLDEASAAYVDAIRLNPRLAAAHLHLGLVRVAQDRQEEALFLFNKAVEIEPKQPAYWEILGAFYQRLERSPEAIVCWQRLLDLMPANPVPAHLALAWALLEENRVAEAEPHYMAALALAPDSPDVHLSLGMFHQDRGELEEAEAEYRNAIELQPDHGPRTGGWQACSAEIYPTPIWIRSGNWWTTRGQPGPTGWATCLA